MPATKDTESPAPRSRHPGLRALQANGAGTWKLAEQDAQSMLPLLRGGETLWWRAERPEALRPGVLVFYGLLRTQPAPAPAGSELGQRLLSERLTLVVHRLVRVGAGEGGVPALITKGDARGALDVERILASELVGAIVAFERDGARHRLDTTAAWRYARAALAISRSGAALYRAGALVDAVLRRLLLGRAQPLVGRPLAFAVQRGGQGILHALFFARCHPRDLGSAP